MSLYVLKPKTENKNLTQYYTIGTGKNVKPVYRLKKNQQPKSKFFTFLFEGTYSVCHFLYFYNLPFAFIHYTFCFNSVSMIESSAAFNMRLSESLFKVSCNFSSMTFFDFNSLISFVKVSAFLVLASEASFSFLNTRSILCRLRALRT